jgi:hypothetical protein
MLDHRLAADVYDERDARADLGDVSEILFRPDAYVSPASDAEFPEFIEDMQI